VGYNRNWGTGGTYVYYTDETQQTTVFNKYKTYNEKTFDTALITLSAATAYATAVLARASTVRGVETITVPLGYHAVTLGDQVGVVTQRGTQSMLGERKAEVVSVEYALETPMMILGIRHGGTVETIVTTEDSILLTDESNAIVMVEA